MAVNKTQGRDSKTQKMHFCPECGEDSKMVRHMPGKSMWGHCKNGHSFRKNDLVLK